MRERLQTILGLLPATLPDAYRDFYAGLSKDLKGKADDATLQRAFGSGVMASLWAEAERTLKDKPEPTTEQLKKTLDQIEALDFASMLRACFQTVSRRLPPVPPGKSPSLNPQQQKAAFAEVRDLKAKARISQKQAYEKVAQKYGVHYRTIQNLWLRTRNQSSKGDDI